MKKRGDEIGQAEEAELQACIYVIFKQCRNNYGTRKIKKELEKQEKIVSKRQIVRFMEQLGFVSNYTVAYFKPQNNRINEAQVANILNREFQQGIELYVLVSDLTYARVVKKWHYVCLFVDLFN